MKRPVRRATERKRGSLLLGAQVRCGEVGVHVSLGVVVCGHFVVFAAFLLEAEPRTFPVEVVILDVHADDGADARKTEHHHRDERAVTQSDEGRGVDAVEELAGVLC